MVCAACVLQNKHCCCIYDKKKVRVETSELSVKTDILKADENGQNNLDKDQIIMARRLCQTISETWGLVGCSWYAVVSSG